jgi:hypothetical protein
MANATQQRQAIVACAIAVLDKPTTWKQLRAEIRNPVWGSDSGWEAHSLINAKQMD